ncbi:hypothetical protein SAMN05192569_100862 [Parageobacillus thermantarcticus]|uniref:Uncharacterized protein n=1 Tax=Parageobacillus thermantarcticus TaxID=186116 RepID=A0A1I0SZJ8_9BACL|nr:hypothetical protein [Parageobacillus thermantarcticus]SFA44922.1 hypothetical protein SAMN05192569_100862 [Parageobacillus thermantarcticus]
MGKLSLFGKITFLLGGVFAVLGIFDLFHVFSLAGETLTSMNYIFIGIMLISASLLYEKKKVKRQKSE